MRAQQSRVYVIHEYNRIALDHLGDESLVHLVPIVAGCERPRLLSVSDDADGPDQQSLASAGPGNRWRVQQ